MKGSRKIWIGVSAAVIVACLCLAVICIGVAGYLVYQSSQNPAPIPEQLETPERVPLPTRRPTTTPRPSPTPRPQQSPTPFSAGPIDSRAAENLAVLEAEIVPVNDPVDLAERLLGVSNIPQQVPPPERPYRLGDQTRFWVTNGDTAESRQIDATLRYLNEVVYFWIEDGVQYDTADLSRLTDEFAESIYPTNREFFGSELNPGIDGDPRLFVLYASDIGSRVAGYFSSSDSTHPEANEYSNAHEMFVLSADNVTLGEEYVYGVMAHEFQHMIHYTLDRNEESWINEGFAELAVLLNGYDPGGKEYAYIIDPDVQLNTWEDLSSDNSTAHYGSSFLFTTYFLGRFGEVATQALVADPANGMDSIDAVLSKLDLKNEDGVPLTADEVFADWTIANFLPEDTIDGSRFNYPLYPTAPDAMATETFYECPFDTTGDVTQYGVDYLSIGCVGSYTLTFEGALQTPLLPADPYSGAFAFWSNQGDESDMTLTREFDFSQVNAPISLSYRTWYDLEEDYDYVYLLASTDGKAWQQLRVPSGTDTNPSGNNYGWGYTGASDEWISEEVDLSEYAGKKVWLRFEYVTDAALNGRGLLLDDIAVQALGYNSDLENDEGGWQGEGFVRVTNLLPQTFRVTLIKSGPAQTTVEEVELDANQRASVDVRIGGAVDEVIVLISGTTRFTTERADYRLGVR